MFNKSKVITFLLFIGIATNQITDARTISGIGQIFNRQKNIGEAPQPAPFEITPEQIEEFERDGFVVIRGLLQGKELHDAITAANRVQRGKSLAARLVSSLFSRAPYANIEFQTWRRYPAMENVAFDSAAPTICAKLMGLDESRPMRLLKDAFLGYRIGDVGCGWHVDDKYFWPCEDRRIGKRDAGANVWITLDTVTAEEGGGLAVAPRSHRARFAKKAREVIAGGQMATCHLQTLAPDCNEEMERLKKLHDLQPGDAIIHNRYIFHRPEPFSDLVKKGKKGGTKKRISLRYVPADATFVNSNMSDDKVIKVKNISTGDFVSKGEEYFPQVWPWRLPEEMNKKVLPDAPLFSFGTVLKIIRIKTAARNQSG